jgi:hypothetical protein
VFNMSQRDAVFTPLMLRVRATLDHDDTMGNWTPPQVRPSEIRRVAAAAHEWFELRARAEQVVAEANAMLAARAPTIDLVDEAGTGELAFVLRHGSRSVRVSMGRRRQRAWVDLPSERPPEGGPVEPADGSALEDLIIDMLRTGRHRNEYVNG